MPCLISRMYVDVHTVAYARSHRFVMISSLLHSMRSLSSFASPLHLLFVRFSAVENASLIKSILGNRRYMTDRRVPRRLRGGTSNRENESRKRRKYYSSWGATPSLSFLRPFREEFSPFSSRLVLVPAQASGTFGGVHRAANHLAINRETESETESIRLEKLTRRWQLI